MGKWYTQTDNHSIKEAVLQHRFMGAVGTWVMWQTTESKTITCVCVCVCVGLGGFLIAFQRKEDFQAEI